MNPITHTDYTTPVYAAYALVATLLTVWLARVLGKNGQIFLDRVFSADPEFAKALNHLLVVGFYLVNFGYACLHLTAWNVFDVRGAVEMLAQKLGSLLLVLAAMHFANLYVFNRIRRSADTRKVEPPVAPHAHVAVAAPLAA